ncbi:Rap1-interacting factor 1 N terminal-domain-containing protein [Calycina marina]|uniref:Rap1-interacting factor 1 N terminal-domain-containing protein n=1 Tax=Calycina marina TaxID=1763456 RepID=A0A9P8CEG9_9HELO|nr:Rap1-interacting factor 1 N terminal-domain-containing protein [Calycina marina]
MVPQAFHSPKPYTHLPNPKPTTPKEPYISEIKHSTLNRLSKEARSKAIFESTPESSLESPSTSAVSRKKVNWPDNDERNSSPVVNSIPVSGERKPIKSILKPYNGVNVSSFNLAPSKLSAPHAYANLATMLDSILQQLEGDDRISKMDAYTTLSGCIRASDNVPEIRALKERMNPLLKCMKRDLVAKTSTGSWDTSLVVNDLVLLSSFLHKAAIADILPTDFCGYVVDHAIKTFRDPTMSKDVVKHLMFIIAWQRFSPKIMNADRVGKLITALHGIENFVKGKSIITGRIDIYKNFIRFSKSHMIDNHVWIEDLFNGMLSSLRETRTLAIEFGLESALLYGTDPKISRAVAELFSRQFVENETSISFAAYYAGRLKETLLEKVNGSPSVPQIWSVPILFLRCRPKQCEQWAFLKPWLKVLQKCFNSSDSRTKMEANTAWSRLVFAIGLDGETSPLLVKMLCLPYIEQLKRKASRTRKSTFSGIYFLLYYSLKPTSTSSQLDFYWDAYVKEIVGKSLTAEEFEGNPELVRKDLIDACIILKSMFDCVTPRPWKDTRALDFGSPEITTMKANELPALDSKWLRKNAPRVFNVLTPLLSKLFWDLCDDEEVITTLFATYITSIASPAAKEIKVSNETMACVAEIFNLLYQIWQAGPSGVASLSRSNGSSDESFLGSFGNIIQTAIHGLGPLPFTEKLLSIGSKDNFLVVATPSHHPKSLKGEVQCPLHHLFVLLTTICPGLIYDNKFLEMVRQILHPIFEGRQSTKAQMDFVVDLLHLLPLENTEPCKMIWQVLAELATFAIDRRDGAGNNGLALGMEYRNHLRILKHGVELSPLEPLPGWRRFFEALVLSSATDAGDGGTALAVIEPLADAILPKVGKDAIASYAYCSMLVAKATYPRDRPVLDAARKKLSGVPKTHKTSGCDPYSSLYAYLRTCLLSSYKSFVKGHEFDIVAATTSLISRCPESGVDAVLEKLQEGIGCWVLDSESKLVSGHSSFMAVTNLWGRVCTHFCQTKITHKQNKQLQALEVLISSGLESKHKSIVVSTIKLWNTTFGTFTDGLEYPTRLADALLRLRSIGADLNLPSFPHNLETKVSAEQRQRPSFPETQDDFMDYISSTSPSYNLPASIAKSVSLHYSGSATAMKSVRAAPTSKSREQTPEFSRRKSKKRVSTPKLRHDDSRIQFETIESSPFPDSDAESQHLTERQKEVKERQQAEATAMFPDIRPTPTSKADVAQRRMSSASKRAILPPHRSASKTRLIISPTVGRQTTPIPQGEFDAFLHSSPTPTRSLRPDANDTAPPSSPPENLQHQVTRNWSGIPYSPHDSTTEPMTESAISNEQPAAQMNLFDRPISTMDFEINYRDVAMIDDSIQQQDHVYVATLGTSVNSMDATSAIKSKLNGASQVEEALPSHVPNTPQRLQRQTYMDRRTPKTTVFHDALESPDVPSFDKQTEVAFVDAISSAEHREESRSSPISDLDQSGVFRLIAEFDQGSGRSRQLPRTVERYRTRPEAEPSSEVSVTVGQKASNKPLVTDANRLQPTAPEVGAAASSVQMSSSSLIPETPGLRITKEWIFNKGERLDPNDTIIVDVPEAIDEFPNVSRKRKWSVSPRKRYSVFVEIPHKKIRTEDESEKVAPHNKPFITKKRRGRPSRSSLTTSQDHASQQSDNTNSLSFANEYVDLSMSTQSQQIASPSIELHVMEAMALISNIHEAHKAETISMEDIAEDTLVADQVASEIAASARPPNEASIDETNLQARVGALEDSQMDGVEDFTAAEAHCVEDPVPETSLPASTEHLRGQERTNPVEVDVPIHTEEMETVSTKPQAKSRLQSIIDFFRSAVLTKDEASEFEDQLDDAKEQWLGAKRRGRRTSR